MAVKKTLRRKKIVKEVSLGPDRNVCYIFKCTECKKVQTGECSCPPSKTEVKTIHYRHLCPKCSKKKKL